MLTGSREWVCLGRRVHFSATSACFFLGTWQWCWGDCCRWDVYMSVLRGLPGIVTPSLCPPTPSGVRGLFPMFPPTSSWQTWKCFPISELRWQVIWKVLFPLRVSQMQWGFLFRAGLLAFFLLICEEFFTYFGDESVFSVIYDETSLRISLL